MGCFGVFFAFSDEERAERVELPLTCSNMQYSICAAHFPKNLNPFTSLGQSLFWGLIQRQSAGLPDPEDLVITGGGGEGLPYSNAGSKDKPVH